MPPIRELNREEFPKRLLETPSPPKKLYLRGNLPPLGLKILAVVGAREHTPYGADACDSLIGGLENYPIAIVSGLALGIDALAHRAALTHHIPTFAVPGSGLGDEALYPRTNKKLAEDIVAAGGGLISEFEEDFKATDWSFPQRNRIMAGLAHAVLIIEAEKKSGTLITAKLALDYNRDVLAVPGSIFSKKSEGPNFLLSLGAAPARESADILRALGLSPPEGSTENAAAGAAPKAKKREDCSEKENQILELLLEPLSKEDIIVQSELPPFEVNILISLLEMKGYIDQRLGLIRRI